MRPTRWSFVCAVCVATSLAFAASCATGGHNGIDFQDASVQTHQDGSVNVKMDSSVMMPGDAPQADASVPMPYASMAMPDAASGPFCAMNSDCTNAGECCYAINGVGFCAPGTVIAGVCFPIQ